MTDDRIGAVLGEDDDPLDRFASARKSSLVSAKLRFGWRVPSTLGLDDDMKVGTPKLDVRVAAIKFVVFLEFDQDRFIQSSTWGETIHKSAQQWSTARQTEPERSRHVVLVSSEQIEERLDGAAMEDEVGHASRF